MMKKPPLPDILKLILSERFQFCPNCGEHTLDNRIKSINSKKGTAVMSPISIRDYSHRTILFECIRCGLRFSVKWKTFITMLKNLHKVVYFGEQKEEVPKYYEQMIKSLPIFLEKLGKFLKEKRGLESPWKKD